MFHKVSDSCGFFLSNACFLFQIVSSVTEYIFSLFLGIVFKKRLMLVVEPAVGLHMTFIVHSLIYIRGKTCIRNDQYLHCFRSLLSNIRQNLFGNGNSGVFRLCCFFCRGQESLLHRYITKPQRFPCIDPIKHFVKKLGLGETFNVFIYLYRCGSCTLTCVLEPPFSF